MVWSAPFLEKYHRAPADMRRYTNDSALALLTGAGLCVRSLVRTGNDMLASGYLVGMGSQDFNHEELANPIVPHLAAAAAAAAAGSGGGRDEGAQSAVAPGRSESTAAAGTGAPSAAASSAPPRLYYGVVVLAQAPPCDAPL